MKRPTAPRVPARGGKVTVEPSKGGDLFWLKLPWPKHHFPYLGPLDSKHIAEAQAKKLNEYIRRTYRKVARPVARGKRRK